MAVNLHLRSELYVSGLDKPVAIIQDPSDPDRQYIVEQQHEGFGRIRVVLAGVLQPAPFLSIGPVSTGSEQGLLGLALAPDFATSGHFFVDYTDALGNTRIERYTRSQDDPFVADPKSGLPIMSIAEPFDTHQGGCINFGEDGDLYIATGDGGGENDPGNRAQTVTNMLLGKLLRIDPSRDDFPLDPNRNYGIPPTNPFVGRVGDDEIWAFGLRNPKKWSFDPQSQCGTGGMWLNDTALNAHDEIDYQPAGVGGQNYGWRQMQGVVDTGLGGLSSDYPELTPPANGWQRTPPHCDIAGYVYRGLRLSSQYWGTYFYADSAGRDVFSQPVVYDSAGKPTLWELSRQTNELGGYETTGNISSFGTDAEGELFFVNYLQGSVYRIRPLLGAWLTDIATHLGRIVSGGSLATLRAADSIATRVVALDQTNSTVAFGLRFGFHADSPTATFNTGIRLRAGGASRMFVTISYRNWTTGQMDQANSYLLNQGEQWTGIGGGTAPNKYRRQSDGRVEMEVGVSVKSQNRSVRPYFDIDQGDIYY